MNFIKNFIEFDKLYLVWQAKDDPERRRFTVGELNKNETLHYLKNSKDFEKALDYGFEGYPAFDMKQEYHTQGVMDAFMRRLPPRNRGDFNEYLKNLRLPENAEISDFSLLGYSGARLPGDGFMIIPSFENKSGAHEFLIEVAGFHHISDLKIDDIPLGAEVQFEKEPDNKFDPDAICIKLNKNRIGYVTRANLFDFHSWLSEGRQIRAFIERKNGYLDNPILYLFVQVKDEIRNMPQRI